MSGEYLKILCVRSAAVPLPKSRLQDTRYKIQDTKLYLNSVW